MEPPALSAADRLELERIDAHPLTWLLRRHARTVEELDRALASRMALRPLDYDAMGAILDAESDPIGPVELAARLGISAGSATELVDRLERAGHVRRDRSGADRRRVRVIPEPSAIGRLLSELKPLLHDLDEVAEQLSPDEQAVVRRFLDEAGARMHAHADRLAAPASIEERDSSS